MINTLTPEALDQTFRGTIISSDPLIIYSGMYAGQAEPNSFSNLAEALSDKHVTWLVLLAWTAEKGSESAKVITEWRRALLDKHKNHRIIFMTNTHAEAHYLTSLGAEAKFHNHNTFVDRNMFNTINREKHYDAVYNAQFLSFKRHQLCSSLSSIVFIGYNFDNPHYETIRNLLPSAEYANLTQGGEKKWLTQVEVNDIYSQASVGLCLSANEGAMHASIEYLLAGIPIVTTVNKGGRDYYFDGRYVRWCDDHPEEVASAVLALKYESIDPNFIRTETLKRLEENLDRFTSDISHTLGMSEAQFKHDLESSWNDKLIVPKKLTNLLSSIS